MAGQCETTDPSAPELADVIRTLAAEIGALRVRLEHAERMADLRGRRLDKMGQRLDLLQPMVVDARVEAAGARRRSLLAIEGVNLARLRIDILVGMPLPVAMPPGPMDLEAEDAGGCGGSGGFV